MAVRPPLLTTAEVADILGVKPATVYAYVSRGLLSSHRNAHGKGSLFDRAEVDAFRSVRNRPTTPGIQTGITLIEDGALHYRGQEAVDLAQVASFEEVVSLLWTGVREYAEFKPDENLRRLAEAVIAPLPRAARHTDRLRVIVAAAAAGDPLRFDTSPGSVIATGRALLATMVAALPAARQSAGEPGSDDTLDDEPPHVALERPGADTASGRRDAAEDETSWHENVDSGPQHPARERSGDAAGDVTSDGPGRGLYVWDRKGTSRREASDRTRIAEVLWSRLTPREPLPRDVNLLGAALILLADHDIAASTLAARVAASTRAHPYAVVGAGLAALDGPLHGAASSLAHALLAEAMTRPDPVTTIADLLRNGDVVPGFGHRLYPGGDPRAAELLDMLGDTRTRDVADRLSEAMRARSGVHPNVDFALAAITLEHGMAPDAGETIFAVARTAGWIAHALEEYADRPSRFRPSGEYAGRQPSAPPRR